jgi:hypothetical protein
LSQLLGGDYQAYNGTEIGEYIEELVMMCADSRAALET